MWLIDGQFDERTENTPTIEAFAESMDSMNQSTHGIRLRSRNQRAWGIRVFDESEHYSPRRSKALKESGHKRNHITRRMKALEESKHSRNQGAQGITARDESEHSRNEGVIKALEESERWRSLSTREIRALTESTDSINQSTKLHPLVHKA